MIKKYTQVNFRLPLDLKEEIEQSASITGNSITAEIVERLRNSFEYDNLMLKNIELQSELINLESEKLDLLLEYQDKLFKIQDQILEELKKK
ncbi:MAG TPA: Arc family DNA-binding protein [Flavobacterium sp.]|jgi:uncharacterized protein (DUF1778 family)|nr:Arc family DNA-binding protein [Flavobacterium sp.]